MNEHDDRFCTVPDVDKSTFSFPTVSPACANCYNNPANGGSGICNCILGTPQVT